MLSPYQKKIIQKYIESGHKILGNSTQDKAFKNGVAGKEVTYDPTGGAYAAYQAGIQMAEEMKKSICSCCTSLFDTRSSVSKDPDACDNCIDILQSNEKFCELVDINRSPHTFSVLTSYEADQLVHDLSEKGFGYGEIVQICYSVFYKHIDRAIKDAKRLEELNRKTMETIAKADKLMAESSDKTQ